MKDKIIYLMETAGLTWLIPLVRLASGESPLRQLQQLTLLMGLPLLAMLTFLFFWHVGAAKVETSLGQLPGPVQVWQQSSQLIDEHQA